MTNQKITVSFLIRRSVRYLMVAHSFRPIQAVVVLAALSFVLTGSRVATIDRFGDRADIVASIFITALAIAVLRTATHHVMGAGGPVIGSILDGPYEQETVQPESGDVLVAYTDGVTES